jgi:hypothetical protein
MICRFGYKYIMPMGCAHIRDKRLLRKETLSRKDSTSVWVILAYVGEPPFGRMDFTILLRATLSVAHLFRHQRPHWAVIRMHDPRLDDLMSIGRGPMAVGRGSTVWTMPMLRAQGRRPSHRTEVKSR